MIFLKYSSNDRNLWKDMSMDSQDTVLQDETNGNFFLISNQELCNIKVWSGDSHGVST